MNCSTCGAKLNVDNDGLPVYWKGTRKLVNGHSVPDQVERVYCSAECSLAEKEGLV